VTDSRRIVALGQEMAAVAETVLDVPPASTYRMFNNPILREYALINRIREGVPVSRAMAAMDAGIAAAAQAHARLSGVSAAGAWWRTLVEQEDDPLLKALFDSGRLIAEGRELRLLVATDFDALARSLHEAGLAERGTDVELDEARMTVLRDLPELGGQGFGHIWFPDRSENRRVLSIEEAVSGLYALMFEYCHRLRFTRLVRAVPGGRYRAGLHFRHNDEPGQYRLEILAQHQDRSRTTLVSRTLRGPPDEWEDVTLGFEAPEDATTIFFNLFINGQAPSSRCWIDDLFIGQYEAAP